MWVTDLQARDGKPVSVDLHFDGIYSISMMRIWNYNHSRVHVNRGVRELTMLLDGEVIFQGEVRMGTGEMAGALDGAEIILYTLDEETLGYIEENDDALILIQEQEQVEERQDMNGALLRPEAVVARPPTRGRNFDTVDVVLGEEQGSEEMALYGDLEGDAGYGEALLEGDERREDALYDDLIEEDTSLTPERGDQAPLSPTSALIAPSFLSEVSTGMVGGTPIGDRPTTVTGRREALPDDSRPQGDLGSSPPQDGLEERSTTVDRPITACAPSMGLGGVGMPHKRSNPRQVRPGTMMTLGEEGPSFGFGGVKEKAPPTTRFVRLELLETWGDVEVGLTGFTLIDARGGNIPVSRSGVSLHLRDSRGNLKPVRDNTLNRLVDGVNLTTDLSHMWSYKFSPRMVISIDLGMPRHFKAIKIYNYNPNLNESFMGVKHFEMHLDALQSETYSTRKAPGKADFDFSHEILVRQPQEDEGPVGPRPMTAQPSRKDNEALHSAFEKAMRRSSHNDFVKQDYMTVLLPFGYVVRLELLSTWGDAHYMGLNGVEVYDSFNTKIKLDKDLVHAVPESIRHLAGMEKDVRTLDKLFDGVNDTRDDRHMWLVPNTMGEPAQVYICLNEPIGLSMVKIWNYSKTPGRGVKDFAIFVDDSMVYKGTMRQATGGKANCVPQTILFTNDAEVMREEGSNIYCSEDQDAGPVFLEEGEKVQHADMQ